MTHVYRAAINGMVDAAGAATFNLATYKIRGAAREAMLYPVGYLMSMIKAAIHNRQTEDEDLE